MSADYSKLKKEELVEKVLELEAENQALTETIEELQKANKEAANSKPEKGYVFDFDGKKYRISIPAIKHKGEVVTAKDIASNPTKYKQLILDMIRKKVSFLTLLN
jgi:hypothetical protein